MFLTGCRGNEWYRRLIRSNRPLYRACPKHTKLLVSKAIVQAVEQQGGQFLDKDKSNGKWKKVAYKRAVDKTSQGLRERDRDENASADGDNDEDQVVVPDSFSGRNTNVNLNELASVAIHHANSGFVRAPSMQMSAPQLGVGMSSIGKLSTHNNPVMAKQTMESMTSPGIQQRGLSSALKQQRMEEFNDDMNPLPPGLAMRQSSMFRMLKHVQLLPGVSDVGQPEAQSTFSTKPKNVPNDGKPKKKRSLIDDDDDEDDANNPFASQPMPSYQIPQSRFSTPHGDLASSAHQPPQLQPGLTTQIMQTFGAPPFSSFQSIPSLGGNQLGTPQMGSGQYGQSQLLHQMSQGSPAQLMNQLQLQQQLSPMNQAFQQQLSQLQLQQQFSQGQLPLQSQLSQQLSQGQLINQLQLQQQMSSRQLQMMCQMQQQASGGLPRLTSGQSMPAPLLNGPRISSQMAFQPMASTAMNSSQQKPIGKQEESANVPSFTHLKSQVSDWLKNSFWPVGANHPSAAQQLELRRQQQQQQRIDVDEVKNDTHQMSRQLAVTTATAISKMIPPPAPGAIQERQGNKRLKLGLENGIIMDERQLPIITTVPPPGPQKTIQINTIPPIATKNKHPVDGFDKKKLKRLPKSKTRSCDAETGTVAGISMTSEVERSVSASLLSLASTPTGLFQGLSSLFANNDTSPTNQLDTRPIPPNTDDRSHTPDFPTVGLKKSKKSLLDDDDDEPPEEARLRTVPW